MKNEQQLVDNIEAIISEMEHEDFKLSKKEQFLEKMLCGSELNNTDYYYNMLCDGMPEDDIKYILEKKLQSIATKRLELLLQMELCDDLKDDTLKRIESNELTKEFFNNLFE